MKIVDSEVIRGREQGLIDAINASMDWSAIWDVFIKEYKLNIEEDAECKRGDEVLINMAMPREVMLPEGIFLMVSEDKGVYGIFQ